MVWDNATQKQSFKEGTGDKEQCEAEEMCNWGSWSTPITTKTDCESAAGVAIEDSKNMFCAECHGPQCNEISRAPKCTYSMQSQDAINTKAKCDAYDKCEQKLNVTEFWDTSHNYHVKDATTLATCIPDKVRGLPKTYSWVWDGVEYSHSQVRGQHETVCQSDTIANKTDCNSFTSAGDKIHWKWWDAGLNGGSGICRSYPKTFTKVGCEAVEGTWLWSQGKEWQDGKFDTKAKCETGVCSMDQQTTDKDKCEKNSQCSERCPRCMSRGGDNGKLCVLTKVTQSNDCPSPGQWDSTNDICHFNTPKDETECKAIKTDEDASPEAGDKKLVYQDCDHGTREDCSKAENKEYSTSITLDADAAFNTKLQTNLRCVWENWGKCRSKEECEAAGTCDDQDFKDWDDTKLVKGKCTEKWKIVNGRVNHNSCTSSDGITKQHSKLGCIWATNDKSEAWTQVSCEAAGFLWMIGAWSKEKCEGHGSACMQEQWEELKGGMNEKKCDECATEDEGFEWKPYFHWKSGIFKQSFMMPRKWLARTWGSKNTWINTMDMDLLQEKVMSAIIKIMAEATASMFECLASATMVVMTQLSCAAAGKSVDECFGQTTEVKLGQTTAFAGMKNDFKTSGASVKITSEHVDAKADSASVVVTGIPTDSMTDTSAAGFEEVGRRLGSGDKCKEQSVIQNTVGSTVGQLVGDGIKVSMPNVSICIPINSQIDQCSDYTAWDFADAYTKGKVIEPKGAAFMTITKNKKNELCGTATTSGYQFPIKRKAGDKATLDAIKCTSKCFGTSSRGDPTGGKGKGGESFASSLMVAIVAFLALQ